MFTLVQAGTQHSSNGSHGTPGTLETRTPSTPGTSLYRNADQELMVKKIVSIKNFVKNEGLGKVRKNSISQLKNETLTLLYNFGGFTHDNSITFLAHNITFVFA